jgi:hypothetical protein
VAEGNTRASAIYCTFEVRTVLQGPEFYFICEVSCANPLPPPSFISKSREIANERRQRKGERLELLWSLLSLVRASSPPPSSPSRPHPPTQSDRHQQDDTQCQTAKRMRLFVLLFPPPPPAYFLPRCFLLFLPPPSTLRKKKLQRDRESGPGIGGNPKPAHLCLSGATRADVGGYILQAIFDLPCETQRARRSGVKEALGGEGGGGDGSNFV